MHYTCPIFISIHHKGGKEKSNSSLDKFTNYILSSLFYNNENIKPYFTSDESYLLPYTYPSFLDLCISSGPYHIESNSSLDKFSNYINNEIIKPYFISDE